MLEASIGFHTITNSHRFVSDPFGKSNGKTSREKAKEVFNAFIRHGRATGEFNIYSDGEATKPFWSENDFESYPYVKIEYIGKDRGVRWKIWFHNHNKNFQYYAIEATINPKILVGENDYITACNASYLQKMYIAYNTLVRNISKNIPFFYEYTLKRIDYCVNFNLIKMNYKCTVNQMMTLMKRAKIPQHYKEKTVYCKTSKRWISLENSFYLESGCVTINCYDKESVTRKEHPDNLQRILESMGILRYEVQYHQQKLYPIKRTIPENTDRLRLREHYVTEQLMSDEAAHNAIIKYFSQTIMTGDYYVLSKAIKKVKDKGFCLSKEERLIEILKLINRCRGVTKAAKVYIIDQKSADDFNRSLKELNEIGVNPVTIPREWGMDDIPNLLKKYQEINNISD